jgi:DNA-binding beta-propeller fold protein YncE
LLLNPDLTPNRTLSGVLRRPRGVAVDADGRIWVADSGNDRVVAVEQNLSTSQTYGGPGTELGRFSLPWGVASDKGSRVAIADALNRRVQILDQGVFTHLLGSWGTRPSEFDGPLDLEFDSEGRLFVVDTYLEAEGYVRRVQILGPDYEFEDTIWDIQSRLRFTRPVGIGIAPNDVVAVADTGADRVYFFNSDGEHLGGLTTIEGQPSLSSPCDVAFAPGPEGELYMAVLERDPGRIRVLSLSIAEPQTLVATLLPAALVLAVTRKRPRTPTNGQGYREDLSMPTHHQA